MCIAFSFLRRPSQSWTIASTFRTQVPGTPYPILYPLRHPSLGSLGLVFDQAGFLFGLIFCLFPFSLVLVPKGAKRGRPGPLHSRSECTGLFSFVPNHAFCFFSSCILTSFGLLLDKLRPRYMTLCGSRLCIYLPNPIRRLIGSFLRLQSRLP